MKLRENLRFLRRQAGLTQAELAKKMHIKQYNISDYEIGRIEPSIPTLIKFADIFHVSIDFLVGRKVRPAKKPVDGQTPDGKEAALPEENDTEKNVNEYVSDMQTDKYMISINDSIKNLPPEKKKMISDSVAFLVFTFMKDEK